MLAVILASFAFVYWLENKGGFGERSYYSLRFNSPVSGLSPAATAAATSPFRARRPAARKRPSRTSQGVQVPARAI